MGVRTETETVIKRILPYLKRQGYSPETDLDFETAVQTSTRYAKGYVDILVNCGKKTAQFLIEAKRSSKKLSDKDKKQALEYGAGQGVLFVVVTNGTEIQVFNVHNGEPIRWDGKLSDKIPTKSQLSTVLGALKHNSSCTDVSLVEGSHLPFRPGLPLKQLNSLFARCHNAIRDIEKNEEHAYTDLSKLLFLKLLEEKADESEFSLPYTHAFHELAAMPDAQADQVQTAIESMLKKIQGDRYGGVVGGELHLKKPDTFQRVVRELSKVSFNDSGLDVKGAAFEYFVRATLKGKGLGQFFTPRPAIEVMIAIVGREIIVNALLSGEVPKILDPACGTGGFLVFMMKACIAQLDRKLEARSITKETFDKKKSLVMSQVFYGADAFEGAASSAKMNMIIAGDGHTNIVCQDSLKSDSTIWSFSDECYDIIMTNPPFGTSEKENLRPEELLKYPIKTSKGQHLFLQRMVLSAKKGGYICTVIDEGVLNTDTATALRRWILQNTEIKLVLRLPEETFKPNKINVKSSVLLLRKREVPDVDLESSYAITFCDLKSLGYQGSGDPVRGFAFNKLLDELVEQMPNSLDGPQRSGTHWEAYDLDSKELHSDPSVRLDYKYWDRGLLERIKALHGKGGRTVKELNLVSTDRGKSPKADLYVDETDGYALVVKGGSNISAFGDLMITSDSDWVEKVVYDESPERSLVKKGDVLIASTGDGTLGKACVYGADIPAIAEGHVTIVRVDPLVVDPVYLSDYLRCGFGHDQVNRLFSGSTGMVELSKEHVDRIVVDLLGGVDEQRELSRKLRDQEREVVVGRRRIDESLSTARASFHSSCSG